MRILHCLTNSSVGGGQKVAAALVEGLRDIGGHEVAVALPPDGPYFSSFADAGVTTFPAPFRSLSPAEGTVGRILRTFAPEIVHTHGKGAGIHVRSSRHLASTPVVHSFHGFHPPDGLVSGSAYRFIERRLARRTARFACVSEGEAESVRHNLRPEPGQVVVVRNCVDRTRLEQESSAELPAALGAWFGRQQRRRVVAMIARPDPVKDHPMAFAVARDVMMKNQEVAFAFLGVPAEMPGMTELIAEFGERVTAHTAIPSAAPVLVRCSLLLLTSRREGSPLVVREAQVFGVPTIGTDVEGIRDTVQHGIDGLLAPASVDGLAQHIRIMLEDDASYRKLREGALASGHRMNMSAWVDEYERLYAAVRGTR